MDGNVDVVVIDGYIGNMVFKNFEGIVKFIGKMLKEIIMSSFKNKLVGVVLKKDLEIFVKKMDYFEYGGLVLLGLDGMVVKVYGSLNVKVFYFVIK